FQNERAAYIAEANGLKNTGFNAQGVSGKQGLRIHGREILARVRMWLDVRVLGTRPAYSSNAGDLAG
ncbi:MAG: vancomycin high temperature exclusion protein, partial [Akkermansiaceae bacterium]|nr:vancomycin high temperature exclusion protein [Akkermansiaceae bacterium]